MIVDGGHLAAVLRRVGSGGVKDQDVGWFSELSSVLQVPFFEKRGGERGTLTIAHSHPQRVRKTTLAAKFIQGRFHCAEQPVRSLVADFKEEALQEVYLISCSESTRNWGFRS